MRSLRAVAFGGFRYTATMLVPAVAAVLLVATNANAEIVGSAPAFGSSNQAVAVCYYTNGGATAVTFNSSQIFVEPGNALAEVSENCAGSLPPNGRCRTVANIPNNAAVWCRADVSVARLIRGRLEIRFDNGSLIQTTDAR